MDKMSLKKLVNGFWAALLVSLLVQTAAAYASSAGFREDGYAGEKGDELAFRDYVLAQGEATVSIDSNIMIAELHFVSRGPTAEKAYDAQRQAMDGVLKMLKGKNVTETQTSNLLIEPIYGESKADVEWHSDYARISSYKVRNTLTVKVRDPAMFDRVLVESMDLGVNELGNVRFIPDAKAINAAKDKARALALDDAKENAKWQSGVIGRSLGDVVYVGDGTESAVNSRPNWWSGYDVYSNMAAQTSSYLSQGAVEEDGSISPGRMTFKATASVGYLLGKDA
jgi:uncharacterized protein YggE